MNIAKRIIEASGLCYTLKYRYDWQHDLAKNWFEYGNGYRTHYTIDGKRIILIVEDKKTVTIELYSVIDDLTFTVFCHDIKSERKENWEIEGPWCDIVSAFLDEAHEKRQEELQKFVRTFRLPSVFE